MSADLYSTPEHESFRQTVRKFVETELAPRAREFDQMGRIDKSALSQDGRARHARHPLRPEDGAARGLDWSFTAVMFEELARCDNAGVVMGISVQTDMATPSLHQFGTDELRRALSGAGDPGRDGRGDRRHRARRRLRRRRDQDARGARRRPLGDQRLEDLHHQRRHRRLAVPARRHRSRRPATAASRRSWCRPTRPGFSYQPARQDRQLGLGHRAPLLRGRARAGGQHDRRDRPRLPAADDAVPGRATGRLHHLLRRLAAPLGEDAEVLRGAKALRRPPRRTCR